VFSKIVCVVLVSLAAVHASLDLSKPANNDEIIRQVNTKASWWAGHNKRFEGQTVGDVKRLLGFKRMVGTNLPIKAVKPMAVPTNFDARVQWGAECPSTAEVRDQSACGSCWAFGSTEAVTDRVCIASNGTNTVHLSAEDMNSCCSGCGMGCDGGDPGAAWQYYVDSGLVDGGNYNGGGCYPYSLPPCDHHVNGTIGPCPSNEYPTPACTSTCQNTETWANAKHFGASAYQLPTDVPSIQTDIFTYGSVTAAFTVYEDFLAYKSGVYQYTTGQELGGHAVKIIGWGVWTDGTPYWTVANSWNTDWGNKGFFNILRGSDNCGIEDYVVAGLPK